jgi:PTS system mannose-specific IIA component
MSTPVPPVAAPGESAVGVVLISHGPLAAALRDTIRVLEPEDTAEVEALSLAWDEAPEKASARLEKAIGRADRGRGVVILTDMFGGTPSNLALAFLDQGRVEIVSGMNLPMVLKAKGLSRDGKDPHTIAHSLVDRGRRAILAASELMEVERKAP